MDAKPQFIEREPGGGQNSEAAGTRNSRHQIRPRHTAHARLQDRMRDPEEIAQTSTELGSRSGSTGGASGGGGGGRHLDECAAIEFHFEFRMQNAECRKFSRDL